MSTRSVSKPGALLSWCKQKILDHIKLGIAFVGIPYYNECTAANIHAQEKEDDNDR